MSRECSWGWYVFTLWVCPKVSLNLLGLEFGPTAAQKKKKKKKKLDISADGWANQLCACFAMWRQRLEGSMEEANSEQLQREKFRRATQTAFLDVFAKVFT